MLRRVLRSYSICASASYYMCCRSAARRFNNRPRWHRLTWAACLNSGVDQEVSIGVSSASPRCVRRSGYRRESQYARWDGVISRGLTLGRLVCQFYLTKQCAEPLAQQPIIGHHREQTSRCGLSRGRDCNARRVEVYGDQRSAYKIFPAHPHVLIANQGSCLKNDADRLCSVAVMVWTSSA
jgi:hypothetical protein